MTDDFIYHWFKSLEATLIVIARRRSQKGERACLSIYGSEAISGHLCILKSSEYVKYYQVFLNVIIIKSL